MPALNEQQARQAIIGDEPALSQRAHGAFKALIQPEDVEMNYSQFDLAVQGVDELLNDAMSMPFFGNRRVIIVQNPEFLTVIITRI
ncbi:hypothetical protein GQS40_10010|uniref:DNA polymerase III delta N-terminal domain-containing protein n=1 Tax=Leuconostoc lactis TaxID=1246 RepID=A0A6L7ACR7_LEULA|nr:hypothetical protein [Leuconostoc lactis]